MHNGNTRGRHCCKNIPQLHRHVCIVAVQKDDDDAPLLCGETNASLWSRVVFAALNNASCTCVPTKIIITIMFDIIVPKYPGNMKINMDIILNCAQSWGNKRNIMIANMVIQWQYVRSEWKQIRLMSSDKIKKKPWSIKWLKKTVTRCSVGAVLLFQFHSWTTEEHWFSLAPCLCHYSRCCGRPKPLSATSNGFKNFSCTCNRQILWMWQWESTMSQNKRAQWKR